MKLALKHFPLALFLPLLFSGAVFAQQDTGLLDGDTWKEQGLQTIMPTWIEHGTDTVDGQFFAYLDREWNPSGNTLKYPGMLSRHLFSYSAAFMMSGDKRYLRRADKQFAYLLEHGWDREFGGWLYAINRNGTAVDGTKDLFMNIYAITGLTMYYMVTHNRKAMEMITKSRSLLQNNAWDEQNKGYYRRLNREWKVTDSTKVFTPQVAPVSGYLLYLFAATRNQQYLKESRRLLSLVSHRFQDAQTGWIREAFDREWNPGADDRKKERVNIGHNIEVAWLWLRLHAITDEEDYSKKARKLYTKLRESAFHKSGAWIHKMALLNPGNHPPTTNWWIQAYGNMLQLPIYRYEGNSQSLEYFKKGSAFWNTAFVDETYGGTILSATLDGKIARGDKAVRTKTSYHAMELALLNYLYLNLWVANKPVELYFHFNSRSDRKPLCPIPITAPGARISRLNVNGKPVKPGNRKCVELPENATGTISATIR